ncbi:hypothetical protein KJ758_00810 [Patescibacteria group bacterium]|nr:hypothetical protein [Patescibacteria group bacterium]
MEEKILNEILETVGFLKDNMVSKTDLDEGLASVKGELRAEMSEMKGELRAEMSEMKGEMVEMKSDLMTHMDGFIGLHQKLDLELVALRAKYDRLEDYVRQLASHANVELK